MKYVSNYFCQKRCMILPLQTHEPANRYMLSAKRYQGVNAKQIWQTTIERLQSKVQPAVFTTWFQGTAAISFQDGVFIVRVPTTFAKAHLEGRFIDLIRSILSEVAGGPVEVRFVVSK